MGVGDLPVPPPVDPMLASLARELPRGSRHYEPKWDGFRCIAFCSGDETLLLSRNRRPLDRYFPDLTEALSRAGGRRCVLDGEIVAARGDSLDFAALMLRLHPSPSRVEELRRQTPASFVAFDVLAAGDRDLRKEPLAARRALLVDLLADSPAQLLVTPSSHERQAAEHWLAQFTGRGVDGVVAKDPGSPYEAGRRSKHWLKVKPERTADCVVGGFRLFQGEPSVSSLLLGLYDGGVLRHAGVAASFSKHRRRELLDALRPHVTPLAGHPWQHGFALERGPMGRLAGAAGAWDPATMALDWIPVRPELVCEVAHGQMDAGGRWRHPVRFLRWRADRRPHECTYDQLAASGSPATALLGL